MMTVGPFLTREAAEARASSYEARGYSCEIVEAPGVISGPFSLRCAVATSASDGGGE